MRIFGLQHPSMQRSLLKNICVGNQKSVGSEKFKSTVNLLVQQLLKKVFLANYRQRLTMPNHSKAIISLHSTAFNMKMLLKTTEGNTWTENKISACRNNIMSRCATISSRVDFLQLNSLSVNTVDLDLIEAKINTPLVISNDQNFFLNTPLLHILTVYRPYIDFY